MSKKLKRFIGTFAITMIGFGCVSFAFQNVGPMLTDKYYSAIHWGIDVLGILVAVAFGWRIYARFHHGDCFIDD